MSYTKVSSCLSPDATVVTPTVLTPNLRHVRHLVHDEYLSHRVPAGAHDKAGNWVETELSIGR